jgi:hypothetical protein
MINGLGCLQWLVHKPKNEKTEKVNQSNKYWSLEVAVFVDDSSLGSLFFSSDARVDLLKKPIAFNF